MRLDFEDLLGDIDFYAIVYPESTHLHNSYLIKKKQDKLAIITRILREHPNAFGGRTVKSVYREWKAHNVLYKFGVSKERTRDADIEHSITFKHKLGYFLISIFGLDF